MELKEIIAERPTRNIYRDGDKVIKLFVKDYSQAKVLDEALNQTMAVDLGLNVPKILEVCKINGCWAIVSEYKEGTTLSHIIRDNPERLEELMNRFTDLQIQINSIESYMLNDQIAKINMSIEMFGMDAITRFALHGKLNSMHHYNNVCHGDFVPSNVMLTPDNQLVILDWTHVTKGNPLLDIATTYAQLCAHIQNPVLAETYLRMITEKTNYTKEEINKWVPIVSAALAAKTSTKEVQQRFLDLYLSME